MNLNPQMNSTLSIGEPWMWAAFIAFVLLMLALDLFVFGGRKAHKVSVKEAAAWSLVWVSLALTFNAGLWWYLNGTLGPEIADRKALEFLTGYLIEKSLSVDNVFIFLLIFSSFHVAPEYQRRVLIYRCAGRHRHARHHDPGRCLASAASSTGYSIFSAHSW